MESDIVEQLRDDAEINEMDPAKLPSEWKILREAAAEIERLRAELSKKVAKLARMRRQRDEAVELYTDLLRRLSVSTPPRHAFLSGDAREKEGGGA